MSLFHADWAPAFWSDCVRRMMTAYRWTFVESGYGLVPLHDHMPTVLTSHELTEPVLKQSAVHKAYLENDPSAAVGTSQPFLGNTVGGPTHLGWFRMNVCFKCALTCTKFRNMCVNCRYSESRCWDIYENTMFVRRFCILWNACTWEHLTLVTISSILCFSLGVETQHCDTNLAAIRVCCKILSYVDPCESVLCISVVSVFTEIFTWPVEAIFWPAPQDKSYPEITLFLQGAGCTFS